MRSKLGSSQQRNGQDELPEVMSVARGAGEELRAWPGRGGRAEEVGLWSSSSLIWARHERSGKNLGGLPQTHVHPIKRTELGSNSHHPSAVPQEVASDESVFRLAFSGMSFMKEENLPVQRIPEIYLG